MDPRAHTRQPSNPQGSQPQTPPTDPTRQTLPLHRTPKQQRTRQQGTLLHREGALQPQRLRQRRPTIPETLRRSLHLFYQKIAAIHNSVNTSPPPDPTPNNSSHADRLTTWTHVDDAETLKTMISIHSGSPSVPCPHHVFNKADTTIAPQLCKIINLTFNTATFPDSWKRTDIQPLLKKPKADLNDLKNF
ncbi:hypothetical protein NDU88_000012 [Pleurodeles waltl]|uniref:Uncharacterized protein n=1 Tax=Pleurodeles waltl TaxID=8319 RepID=A0AAV7R8T1_PLEWA|nr:hypothetical protein NDU88_000012 [Pleurodeles waltl]